MVRVDEEHFEVDAFAKAVRLTTAFYAWERRGRGWDLWPYPTVVEPPFRPFALGQASVLPVTDDARKPTALGAWFDRLAGRTRPTAMAEVEELIEPEPGAAQHFQISEIQVALGPDVKVAPDLAEHFLLSLSTCVGPLSFEIIGTSESITIQLACAESDASHVQEQIRAYFPEAVISEARSFLIDEWAAARGTPVIIDFGLSQEFMRPIRTFSRFDVDPLIGVLGSVGDLIPGEVAVLQVLFQATRAPWSGNIARSVTDWQGEAFFVDAPELVGLAKQKTDRPLFAAVIRTAVKSSDSSRAWQIAKRVGGALAQVANPSSNELIALSNEDYPHDVHASDVLHRQTHRTGALLNSEELVSLVHPPSASVRSSRLARDHRRTKAVPKALLGQEMCLGENTYGGVTQRVTLGLEQRLRHTHVVGASGTGKSTLLLNMLVQDMEHGHGLALIDPHGDLIDDVLARVPDARIQDVVLVDPSDTDFPVGFNVLSAHSDLERTLLSSDLVAVFRRLSTSWGDQMTSVLSNAVLAFLESSRGGTLADLRRFLVEANFRNEFLRTVQDQEVVYYWQKEFPLLTGKPQAPLLTRLDAFLRPRLVRAMVTQPQGLDFASIMNGGKILLVKLAQGAIGEENAALLGSLFVSKIHQLALGRQSLSEADRRPFVLYLDEFQHFITPSMATLLTGARKYRIGLVLAHQELRQLWNQDRDVAGAVLANATTRICFRVGDDDARKLEEGFATFTVRDLQNLRVGQAVCRVERSEWDFSLDAMPPPAQVSDAPAHRDLIVRASRERYAGRLAPVERNAEPPALSDPRPPIRQAPSRRQTQHAEERIRPSRDEHVVPDTSAALPGRGGAQHKYLQELIRRWAEAHGWRTTVEQRIFDGLGHVDVLLERSDVSVACEIGCSTTPEHELQNIQKCLAAGFTHVCALVIEKKRIGRMEAAVQTLPDEARARVLVAEPAGFFKFLEALAIPATKDTSVGGYQVKVRYQAAGDANARRQSIARTIVGTIRRLRK